MINSIPLNSDIQYYIKYFQQNHKATLSEVEISDVLNQNDAELVFPELVKLAETKKQNLDINIKKESPTENILLENQKINNNLQQNYNNSNTNKSKKTISLSANFHGFNVNSASMFSRRILYDVDENRNYKILFNVGRGSHSDGKEKIRPEIEHVIHYIKEKTNINIYQETSRNPGIIALSIDKSNDKKSKM